MVRLEGSKLVFVPLRENTMKKFRIEMFGINGEIIASATRCVTMDFLANDDKYIGNFDEYLDVELLGLYEYMMTCDSLFKITRIR